MVWHTLCTNSTRHTWLIALSAPESKRNHGPRKQSKHEFCSNIDSSHWAWFHTYCTKLHPNKWMVHMIHERERSNIKYWCITAQSYWVEFTAMWIVKYCTFINIIEGKRILRVSIIGLTSGNYIYYHKGIELLNIWEILGNYEMISKLNKNEMQF